MDELTPKSPINQETLQRVWNWHGLGPVRQVRRLSRGALNRATLVNENWVIRFDTLGKTYPRVESGSLAGTRFAAEAAAFQLLAAAGLPTPRVIAFDESRRVLPMPYLIASRLPGQPLIEQWNELDAAARRALAYEAGEWLARIHEVQLHRFGRLTDILTPNGSPGGFESWADYVTDHCRRYLAQAEQLGALDQETIQTMHACVQATYPQLEQVQTGRLIHADYHFENLLVDRGRLSGVIDLEWAFSADPTWDFIVQPRWEATCPGSEAPLLAGYRAHRPLDDGHAERLHLYRMIIQLEIVVANNQKDWPKTIARARQTLQRLLRQANLPQS